MLELIGVTTAELSEVVNTLRGAILEETDFVLEAKRTAQFGEFLERSAQLAGAVTVPKVRAETSRTYLGEHLGEFTAGSPPAARGSAR